MEMSVANFTAMPGARDSNTFVASSTAIGNTLLQVIDSLYYFNSTFSQGWWRGYWDIYYTSPQSFIVTFFNR